MSTTWTKAPLALAILSVVAFLATHVVLLQNGTAKKMLDNITSPRPVLAGTDTPLKITWTGLWPLDLDFSIMITVFSAILDVRNTSLFFQGSHFFGLWMASWMLILLDSHERMSARQRPSWQARYSYVAWGLVMEFASVAVGLPAWCVANLVLYSAPEKPADSLVSGRLTSPESVADLKILSLSFILTTLIPSLLMLACPPSAANALISQQTWILIRLFHPVLLAVVHASLRWIAQPTGSVSRGSSRTSADVATYDLLANWIYSVAFWTAAGPHILLSSAILLTYVAPGLLSVHLFKSLSIGALWPVASIWRSSSSKAETIPLGVSVFMAANEVISTLALGAWAWNKNQSAVQKQPDNGANHFSIATSRVLWLAIGFGPGAAAVTLMENRNKILRTSVSAGDKKKTR